MAGKKVEVMLVKELGYERVCCTCGMAVLPVDPTPEITQRIRDIAVEEDARFSLVDVKVHPEIAAEFNIKALPSVIIEKKVYSLDGDKIREGIRKTKVFYG